METEMKRTNRNTLEDMFSGMNFGTILGGIIGTMYFTSIIGWMIIGSVIGCLVGLMCGSWKDMFINIQLEEDAYTITEILDVTGSRYALLTICGKTGETFKKKIVKKDFNDGIFKIGDLVYIDKRGNVGGIYDEHEGDVVEADIY